MSIEIYALGLCHCSVCVPRGTSRDEIEQQVNLRAPTGISSSWKISQKSFERGESNPCPCNDFPTQRLHYLMVC